MTSSVQENACPCGGHIFVVITPEAEAVWEGAEDLGRGRGRLMHVCLAVLGPMEMAFCLKSICSQKRTLSPGFVDGFCGGVLFEFLSSALQAAFTLSDIMT